MQDYQDRVLIVDDNKTNIHVLVELLRTDYSLSVAMSGQQAIDTAKSIHPDLILLDVMMPDKDGYEVCKELKNNENTKDTPIIFITALTKPEEKALAFEAGGVDYLTKPVEALEVKARVRTHLSLKRATNQLQAQNSTLEQKVMERTKELSQTRIELIRRLSMAAEFKDSDTGEHIIRMSHYCRMLGNCLGLDEDLCDLIYVASPMHDVGKIGIPDSILQKPGKLDAQEWEIMKTHTTIGAKILAGDAHTLLEVARTIALTHHERWDGSGYPHGLRQEEIPIEGRICGICDVFDALTSVRPYKQAWPIEKAVETIRQGAGSHFDPKLVECFLDLLPQITEVRTRYSDPENGTQKNG